MTALLQALAVGVGLLAAVAAIGLAALALALLAFGAIRRSEPPGASWMLAALSAFWAVVAAVALVVARA